jgi:hypothetical protein
LIFILIPILSIFSYYFFHHKVKIYFYDIPSEHIFVNKNFLKSRLTVLFSSVELIASLLLFRISFWSLPSSGMTFISKIGNFLVLTITIPKIELLLLSIILFTAGILTLTYRPIGRMLNILLCFLGLLLGTFHLFFMSQPEHFGDKLHFLIASTGLLIYCFIFYFLLINPNVKEQFKKNADTSFAPRIVGLLTLGLFCFTLLLFLRITSSYFPNAYEAPVPLKRLHIQNKKVQTIGKKFKDLFKASLR